jgi:probable phosphoglycerate mutase
MPALPFCILLVRHGATEWSSSGRHTGRTDVPLTDVGIAQAGALRSILDQRLAGRDDAVVFTSPLSRAAATAARALPHIDAEPADALMELDYGAYEGKTTSEILAIDPSWILFEHGCPGGESIRQVTARCDAFIAKLERVAVDRPVVAFTHGHLSRVLTTRLVGLPVAAAGALWNDTGSVATIREHRGALVLIGWNQRPA